MGAVYRAHDPRLGRAVAIKVFAPGPDRSGKRRARFEREAAAAGRLRHPGIVHVHDAGAAGGLLYLVMDFVEGETLAARIRRAPLPPREAARITAAIARALDHAHGQGIVHRDVKPANILLRTRPDGPSEALLADFGIARDLDSTAGLTATGEIVGTIGYMAPEQLRGNPDDVGPTADVWALGAVLHECVTGRPAFVGEGAPQVMAAILAHDLVPPSAVRPVPEALDAIVACCLDAEPLYRYESAGALADDLDAFRAGRPIAARGGARRRGGAARWIAALVIGLLALGVAGGAATFLARDRDPPRVSFERPRWFAPNEASSILVRGRLSEPCRELRFGETRVVPDGVAFEVRLDVPTERATHLVTAVDLAGNESLPETVTILREAAPPSPIPEGTWWDPTPEQLAAVEETGWPLWFEDDAGMRFVLIPAGELALKKKTLAVAKPFYLAAFELTNEQYTLWNPKHGPQPQNGQPCDGPTQAAPHVSWDEARAFCEWLGETRGQPGAYRLPADAEWEWAYRARTTTRYYWGDEVGGEPLANLGDAVSKVVFDWKHEVAPLDDGHRVAAPVGSFPCNPWGLYDMAGNVYEWTAELRDDGKPALAGGSWFDPPRALTAGARLSSDPFSQYANFGMRVAFDGPPPR